MDKSTIYNERKECYRFLRNKASFIKFNTKQNTILIMSMSILNGKIIFNKQQI